jgi:hypothetical protein
VLGDLDRIVTREKTNVFNFNIKRIGASSTTCHGEIVSIAGIIFLVP